MSDLEIYIKYFLIGDLDTFKQITEYSTNALDSNDKKSASRIFQKISKTEDRQYEIRNKISAKGNNYYFMNYRPNIVFIAFVEDSFPDRLVWQMFDEIRTEEILSMVNESTKELNPNGRQKLKEIIEKYQDKDKLDKIASIQNDVNEVKIEVKKNIDKMVENVEDVEKLQEKSNELKEASHDYKSNSDEIRKITWWQNFKLWIILILVVLLFIGIILIIVLN
jgi:nitrogen fixation/metabolism regulation signal transduction histidine kinase